MKAILSDLRPALVSTGILAVVCCGLYPAAVTAVSRVAFRDKADGSLLRNEKGDIIGSRLLGQNFTGDAWFHTRPSSAGANGYDGASASGSNLGPTSQKLADQIKERAAAYRGENGLDESVRIPADAVTASGSGLDPHISPANARLQAARVARARSLPEEQVEALIRAHTEKPNLGIFGEPGVNVLELNLALEKMGGAPPAVTSPGPAEGAATAPRR